MRERVAQLLGEVGADIAEAPAFALVEIFRDAAGKGHGVDALVGELGRPRRRHQQRPRKLARLPQVDEPHDHARHARGDALAVPRRQRLSERELDAERLGDRFHGRLDAREPILIVLHDQAAADGDGAGGEDAAILDQGELGRAAADIDVEQRRIVAARERDGAGAVRGHLAFHMVAGRGADELSGLLGKELGDGVRVAALERLAGEDHRAAVDLLALDAGIGVAAADEAGEIVDIDGVVGPIRREQDRRLPEDFPADHHEAAR